MAAETDPFSQAFSGLWDVLNASPAFVAAVPENNQVRYDTDARNPDKARGPDATELPADRPFVRIQPAGSSEFPLISTSSTKMEARYQILLALGDLRVNAYLNPLKFIICAALANWEAVLPQLTWKNDQFIKVLRVRDIPEGRNLADAARGIQTWAAILTVSLEMWFSTRKLIGLQVGDVVVGD